MSVYNKNGKMQLLLYVNVIDKISTAGIDG